jgi:hypothetical protein
MRQDIAGKLVSFYRDDVPGYILHAGRTFLKIHAGADFTGYQRNHFHLLKWIRGRY